MASACRAGAREEQRVERVTVSIARAEFQGAPELALGCHEVSVEQPVHRRERMARRARPVVERHRLQRQLLRRGKHLASRSETEPAEGEQAHGVTGKPGANPGAVRVISRKYRSAVSQALGARLAQLRDGLQEGLDDLRRDDARRRTDRGSPARSAPGLNAAATDAAIARAASCCVDRTADMSHS